MIVHILADGKKVENITGHRIGADAEKFYQVIKKIIEEDKSQCMTAR